MVEEPGLLHVMKNARQEEQPCQLKATCCCLVVVFVVFVVVVVAVIVVFVVVVVVVVVVVIRGGLFQASYDKFSS
jgi:hypothetical protein